MGEKSSNKSHKLTCVYGVSGFNILLTLVTVGYLSYSVYLLNNRVFVLEGKLTQTENSKNGKRVARSSSWEYVKKPCEECKRVCSSMLGKTEKKVSLQSVCFALFSFSLCLNDQTNLNKFAMKSKTYCVFGSFQNLLKRHYCSRLISLKKIPFNISNAGTSVSKPRHDPFYKYSSPDIHHECPLIDASIHPRFTCVNAIIKISF